MYSLPPGLSESILGLISGYNLTPDEQVEFHDRVARFLVRNNRQLRAEVLRLGRDLASCAEKEEEDYGSSVGSYAGEETAQWIARNIIRKRVYLDPDEEAMRELVDEIFGDDEDEEEDEDRGLF